MEIEPEIEEKRDSEALIVVLDTFTKSPEVFKELRDAAFRLARTRLIHGISKDDLIGVIRSGSEETVNNLTSPEKVGYEGVEVVVPPITRSLRAVKALRDSTEGPRSSNLLNITDVCGDVLSGAASKRARKNRVVIFTDGESIVPPIGNDEREDLTETCKLYNEHGIQVDIICHCSDEFADKLHEFEDDLGETEDMTPEELMTKSEALENYFLFVLTRLTNGVLLPFKEAYPLVDRPIAKVKRAVAKFRGVLNIADMIKIPVKRFSFVAEAKPPTAKKVSWAASCKRNQPVSVHVETQRVASAKDDSPLQEEEIVNAYPYGPDLVPEATEVDTYAWSIHLPQGLDVIGFIPQDSISKDLFLGSVDVLIAMSNSDASVKLVKTLVLAMKAENAGILARSVPSAKGGAPRLAFIWPRVEVDRETNRLKNCFFFIADVPMKEDIRELPFGKLEDVLQDIPDPSHRAMNDYISSTMLDPEEDKALPNDDDDSDNDEAFWPPNECNPNLDWFHHCVVHRALDGVSGADLPQMSGWQKRITNPSNFLGKRNESAFADTVASLKSELPVVPVPRREKKGRKLYEALTGDFASIKEYLPAEEINAEDNDEDIENGNDLPAPQVLEESDDVTSQITDVGITDISDETPVSDFETLVRHGKFRFAAVSITVVVRRLIRDLADDERAMRCLQVLRKASIQEREPRIFNDFISSLLGRCSRPDLTGNRTAAFFRYVGRLDKIPSTLDVVPVTKPAGWASRADEDYISSLDEMRSLIRKVADARPADPSASALTRSSTEML